MLVFCLFACLFCFLSKKTAILKGFFEKDDGFACAICVTVSIAVTTINSLEAPLRFKHELLLI